MSISNKIAWLECQLLYPHHFEQQERYLEYIIEQRSSAARAFTHGFSQLKINHGQLHEKQFSLLQIKGIMPDGCIFDNLINANMPPPLEIPGNIKNQLIYLALPTYQPGQTFLNTEPDSRQQSGRYILEHVDTVMYSAEQYSSEKIETARLQPRFLLESEELGGFTYLPVARILEVTTEGAIRLDKNFIAPVIDIAASNTLIHYLDNINGLLEQRSNALSDRFQTDTSSSGSSSISDFMLLQIMNRYKPRLEHFKSIANQTHPESLYLELLGLMGELATFTTATKKPSPVPKYIHENLFVCYQPLIQQINLHLSAVLEQTAISLPVDKRDYGIYVSPIADRSILEDTRLILAIKSDMPTADLKLHIPDHLKIGSVETIRDLVTNQLTGITVDALPIAPREITYTAGYVYFELSKGGDQWASLRRSAGFAFHLAGELNELSIEFWAIRS